MQVFRKCLSVLHFLKCLTDPSPSFCFLPDDFLNFCFSFCLFARFVLLLFFGVSLSLVTHDYAGSTRAPGQKELRFTEQEVQESHLIMSTFSVFHSHLYLFISTHLLKGYNRVNGLKLYLVLKTGLFFTIYPQQVHAVINQKSWGQPACLGVFSALILN